MPVPDAHPPRLDESLVCLAELAAASQELQHRVSQLSQSASSELSGGGMLTYLMPLEKRLVLVEQISAAVRDLTREGNKFRRMQAHTLYAEGLTMAELAAVFGVSRQRVGALLRDGLNGQQDRSASRQEGDGDAVAGAAGGRDGS